MEFLVMNINKLEYILMIAETRSISKASSKLYLAQPYLSRVLSNLEKSLGTKLFDRTKIPLELTKSGERYIQYVKDVLKLESDMKSDINAINAKKREKLIVGISSTRGTHILPFIIPRFQEKYPDIDIIIVEESSPDILENILKKNVDIGFLSLPHYPAEVNCEFVKKEKILLVLPPNHPLGTEEAKGNCNFPVCFDKKLLRQLENDRFILTKKSQSIGIIARRFLTENKLVNCNLLETKNLDTAYRLAVSGAGFTLIPRSCIRTKYSEDEPYYFTLKSSLLEWTTVIACHMDTKIDNFIKTFIEISKAALSST